MRYGAAGSFQILPVLPESAVPSTCARQEASAPHPVNSHENQKAGLGQLSDQGLPDSKPQDAPYGAVTVM
jgi:hypothetical protein